MRERESIAAGLSGPAAPFLMTIYEKEEVLE
jgi:hypothetical protein